MKRVILLCSVVLFLSGCVTTINQVKNEGTVKAQGNLKWQIEDRAGNVISSGEVVDGDVRLASAILVDVIILDKDENGNIKTALMPLGLASGPVLSDFRFQVYHEGVVYPGENFTDQYVLMPDPNKTFKEWNKPEYGIGNYPSAIIHSFGITASKKVPFVGTLPYLIALPEGSSFSAGLGTEYVFKISGFSQYQWRF